MCRLTSPCGMEWPVVLVCDGVDWVKTHNKFKCWWCNSVTVLQFISPLIPHNIPGLHSFTLPMSFSPLSARLAAVVPGSAHQGDAVQGVPVHYLVLSHAVPEVRAGGACLHYGNPGLQVEARDQRGQQEPQQGSSHDH